MGTATTTTATTTATATTTTAWEDGIHAVGDPHMWNIFGQSFDLWKPGWVELLRIPRHTDADAEIKLSLWAHVPRQVALKCHPGVIEEVRFYGTFLQGRKLNVRTPPDSIDGLDEDSC